MPELSLRFDNIGPVRGTVALVFRPGINYLKGPNGSGKSSIIDAATVATSGSGKLNAHRLTLPDGTTATLPASVREGDRVLAKTSRDRAPTAASTIAAAPMAALHSFLTGDGIEDPTKADARRIRSLADLLPEAMSATAADLATLGSTDPLLVGASLLDAERAVREAMNAQALLVERQAAEQAGIAGSKARDIAALVKPPEMPADLAPLVGEDLVALKKSGSALRDTASVTRERANRRVDLERARDSQTPRPKPEELDGDIAALDNSITTVMGRIDETQNEIDRLKAILDGYQAEKRGYDARARELRKQRSDRTTDAARWDEAQKSYAGIPGLPTIADADESDRVLSAALAHYEQVKTAQDLAQKRSTFDSTSATLTVERQTAEDASKSLEAEGKRLRKEAAATPAKVGALMAAKGMPAGLTIADGRLYASVNGRTVLFSDVRGLSDGQRVAVVLEIAMSAFPGRLIPFEGRTIGELQPSALAHFAALAAEKGVIVVTARPTDDECLSVEWVGPNENPDQVTLF